MTNKLFAWSAGDTPPNDITLDIPLRYMQQLTEGDQSGHPYQFVHVQEFRQLRGPSSAGISDPQSVVDSGHLADKLHDQKTSTFASVKRPSNPNGTAGFTLGYGGVPKLFNCAVVTFRRSGGQVVNSPKKITFTLFRDGQIVKGGSKTIEVPDQFPPPPSNPNKFYFDIEAVFDSDDLAADALVIDCSFDTDQLQVDLTEAWGAWKKPAFNPDDLALAIRNHTLRNGQPTTLFFGDELNQTSSFRDYFRVYVSAVRATFYYFEANEKPQLANTIRFSPCGFNGTTTGEIAKWNEANGDRDANDALGYAKKFCRFAHEIGVPVDELRFNRLAPSESAGLTDFASFLELVGQTVSDPEFPGGPRTHWGSCPLCGKR